LPHEASALAECKPEIEKMSVIFSGAISNLEQAIPYELETLDFVRRGLFNQSEESAGYIEITLGDERNEDGVYPPSEFAKARLLNLTLGRWPTFMGKLA
jgi:hypothetical protein